MKVPPDNKINLKPASVVLTKLICKDIPQGVKCNVHELTPTKESNSAGGNSTAKVKDVQELSPTKDPSNSTAKVREASLKRERNTLDFTRAPNNSMPTSHGNSDSPRKRQKTTLTVSDSDNTKPDGKYTAETANQQKYTYTYSKPHSNNKDKFHVMVADKVHVQKSTDQPKTNLEKITAKLMKDRQKIIIDPSGLKKEDNLAENLGKEINTIENSTWNANERLSQTETSIQYKLSDTEKKTDTSKITGTTGKEHVKYNSKSKIKLENITAKLMKQKQELSVDTSSYLLGSINDSKFPKLSIVKQEQEDAVDFLSIVPIENKKNAHYRKTTLCTTLSNVKQEPEDPIEFTSIIPIENSRNSHSVKTTACSTLSNVKQEPEDPIELTSIIPIENSRNPHSRKTTTCSTLSNVKREPEDPVELTSENSKDSHSRKTTACKSFTPIDYKTQYSMKKKAYPEKPCSYVPSIGGFKLIETRNMLKSAISASTYCTRNETFSAPNILSKSRCVFKSAENFKKKSTTTGPRDCILRDPDETASSEITRLKKIEKPGIFEGTTNVKSEKCRQQKITTADTLSSGSSGPPIFHGAVIGEGFDNLKMADRNTSSEEVDRSSPKKVWLTNSVLVKNPNSFPYKQEFKLPVEGTAMTVHRGSPKKTKKVTLTYKSEIGSESPISFQFPSQSPTEDADLSTHDKTSPQSSVKDKHSSAEKTVLKMGKFAISKSQEIIPVNLTDPFPGALKSKVAPKRRCYAITYADYCARMDNAEAAKTEKNNSGINATLKLESNIPQEKQDEKIDADMMRKKCMPLDMDDLKSKDIDMLTITSSDTSFSSQANSSSEMDTSSISAHDFAKYSYVGLGIKQEKGEDSEQKNKNDDDEEDDDSVHLSDHKYTKTPDASPVRMFSQSILKSPSPASISQTKQTPVYAVKCGNKLFLIPGNEKLNKKFDNVTGPKQKTPDLKNISPKGGRYIGNKETPNAKSMSPYLKQNASRKAYLGKIVSKRKLDFVKQILLNKRQGKGRHQSKSKSSTSCKSSRVPAERNAKLVHITPNKGKLRIVASRVSITVTKGRDIELRRWNKYADFWARITYDNDTIKHIDVDEIQPGFYKVTPVHEMSKKNVVTSLLTCLPPHEDAITDGDSFIAIGSLMNVVDTGLGVKQIEEWLPCQLGAKLSSLLPVTALCHGSLYESDVSYRPKMDAPEWYGARFDIFTKKYCRQKRMVQRRKWNPYEKTFSYI